MLRSRPGLELGFGDRAREIRALVDEVASVDWRNPAWSGFAVALAASEALSARDLDAARAAESFVLALQANSGMSADTFMATEVAPPPRELARRVAQAAARAQSVADALHELDRTAPDQRLRQAMRLDGGWLKPVELEGEDVPIAFVHGERAWIARLRPGASDPAWLGDALLGVLAGTPHDALTRVDPDDGAPAGAAAAVAIDPVSLTWARSFHRRAWTRGGGPWMGVADCPPYAVVSTCHAAVDGYLHARVSSAIVRASALGRAGEGRAVPTPAPEGVVAPPSVGFATCRIEGPSPRFATGLHAFAEVLDRRLGGPGPASVPFHVPIAPGHRTDSARWRRRPLYGLLSLSKRDGALESLGELSARLPSFLAREAAGRGLLTRVLRAALELPLPLSARRALISRQPWADRWLAPAQLLTGGGYFSWMRFATPELPTLPMYPSAVPSFAADRGGAGLSIAPYADGLAVGLTTSGSLGSSAAAEDFLDEWLGAVRAHPRGSAQIA